MVDTVILNLGCPLVRTQRGQCWKAMWKSVEKARICVANGNSPQHLSAPLLPQYSEGRKSWVVKIQGLPHLPGKLKVNPITQNKTPQTHGLER